MSTFVNRATFHLAFAVSLLGAQRFALADEVTVVSTGNPAVDPGAIQAAINGAPAEGRTIILKNGAGTDGFVFATAAAAGTTQVVAGTRTSRFTRSIAIRGEPDGLGRMARIAGGRQVIIARMAPGVDFSLEDVHFDDYHFQALLVGSAGNVTVSGCKFTVPSMVGRTNRDLSVGQNFAFAVKLGEAADHNAGIFNMITGGVLIGDNYIDLDTAGTTPTGTDLFSIGIDVRGSAATCDILILDNEVLGCSTVSVLLLDNWGPIEVEGNTCVLTSWVPKRIDGTYHLGRADRSGTAVGWTDGFQRPSNPDQLGSISVERNTLICPGEGRVGVSMQGDEDSASKPGPLRARKNVVMMDGGFAAFLLQRVDGALVGQNEIMGSAKSAFIVGTDPRDANPGTNGNEIVGNKIKDFESTDPDGLVLVFGADAFENVAAGWGFSDDTVLDVTGTNEISGTGDDE